MPSDLLRRLRGLYRPAKPGQAEHQQRHEAALLERLGAQPPSTKTERRRWPRLVLAGGISLAVAVGACALPAEYPMSLGRGLEITVDAEQWEGLDVEQIAEHLSEDLGAERVEVIVETERSEAKDAAGVVHVEESVRMSVLAFGADLDPDVAWDDLHEEFPQLRGADVQQVPLSGTVHGTLGGRLSERLLDLRLDRQGVEAAEAQIRAELLAQGIAPENATIDITTEEGPGHREIRVRVEAEHGEAHEGHRSRP